MNSDTRLIPLTQGQFAIVSAEDYDWLIKWKWYASRTSKTFYAMRKTASPERRSLFMHIAIAERLWGAGALQCDHKDRQGLNNARNNLRLATISQQAMNRGKKSHCMSHLKGATWFKARNHWISRIQAFGKSHYLGSFSSAREAHEAYIEAAKKYHGEFACAG